MKFSISLTAKISKINDFMSANNITICCAESCTGGLLSAAFTAIAGASKIFDRGFVTYSNQSKIDLLNVNNEALIKYGAVSKEIASKMAHGALKNSHADIAIAITGIAGPTGDTANKKIGNVFIAIANKNLTQTFEFNFSGQRNSIRHKTLNQAIITLENFLIDHYKKNVSSGN